MLRVIVRLWSLYLDPWKNLIVSAISTLCESAFEIANDQATVLTKGPRLLIRTRVEDLLPTTDGRGFGSHSVAGTPQSRTGCLKG